LELIQGINAISHKSHHLEVLHFFQRHRYGGGMPKKIKNICLVYRPHSPKAFQIAKEVANWLKEKGLKLYSHPESPAVPGTKKIKVAQIKSLDLVIVLGGDGTFLSAVRLLNAAAVPILGVNMGNLGFLTETKVDELYDVIDLALEGKMQRVERAMVHATIVRKNGHKDSFHALNDIVIERGPYSRLIDIAVYAGPFLVSTVKADGLIIATPTGSTAYCLAAGGPIIQPTVRAFTVTPICPHTLTNRPVILSDDQKIRLKLNRDPGRAVLMLDGQQKEDLTCDDVVIVTRGKKPVIMLSLPTRNYFDVLRAKLRFGQRE
jgi:NAD+ kinase